MATPANKSNQTTGTHSSASKNSTESKHPLLQAQNLIKQAQQLINSPNISANKRAIIDADSFLNSALTSLTFAETSVISPNDPLYNVFSPESQI